jgi:hypothetical protein
LERERNTLAGNEQKQNGDTTPFGKQVVKSTLSKESFNIPDSYLYGINNSALSLTFSRGDCNPAQEYVFGGSMTDIGGCYWVGENQNFGFAFEGKDDEYANLSASDYKQGYYFTSESVNYFTS